MINQIKMTGGSITINSEQWSEIQEKLAEANSVSISLRTQLAKANACIEKLTERCRPSKVIMIDGSGHYVSESVYKEIEQLRKEQG